MSLGGKTDRLEGKNLGLPSDMKRRKGIAGFWCDRIDHLKWAIAVCHERHSTQPRLHTRELMMHDSAWLASKRKGWGKEGNTAGAEHADNKLEVLEGVDLHGASDLADMKRL